jgi:acetyltransferase-like isoleucine patch superfamily enzyme
LSPGAEIEIGAECGISGASISASRSIKIGKRTLLGANSILTDSDYHPIDAKLRYLGEPGLSKPVVIGDDVWIGMNVVVLKGVSIGDRAVIAANSVVVSDIPNDAVAYGCPAKIVRRISR